MALVPFPTQSAQRRPDDDLSPDWDDEDIDAGGAGKMSFLEHLDELRRRIIYSLIGVGVGFLIAFAYIEKLFMFIMLPMQQMLPEGQKLIYTDPSEAFMLQIKIGLMAGLIVASPAVFAQVWLFIAPGLYSHEKRLAIPFILMSSLFFVAGAAFSHFVVFPLTWKFFVSFTSDYLSFMPRIEPAFGLYIKMLFAFGLVFQMPVIVTFLARMGVVTARFLVQKIKYAILIIFIVSAIVTPSGDMWNQSAMAIPMIGLYLVSIGLAWLFGKKRKTNADIPYEL